ncbi:hypothetical protein BDF21DRAFT_495401 [Thamnidium elegans]|nr:hypothetical protein BDF21DRAFT_495401 [Thamnidium elegans]
MTLETMQPFEQSFTILQDQDEDNRSNCIFPSPIADSDSYLLETFHQYPHGDFRPTFYNPFEIKHRRRTSRAQLKVLEKSFFENPKPSATIRRILAQKLDMTPRGVQIWFQNRRAKAKLLRRKSTVQQQRHQQLQSSDENEDDDEEEYSSDSSRSIENKPKKKDSTTSDLNQSSVLFSQFLANVQNNQDIDDLSSFMPTNNNLDQSQPTVMRDNMNWSNWQQHTSISDNVRTVAAVAAATAVATSVAPTNHYDSSMLTLGGAHHWLGHNNDEMFHHQQILRRKSCPAPKNTMTMSDMHYSNQQTAYISSSWPQSMTSRNKEFDNQGNASPIPLLNNFKRNFSYDSNASMDYYSMQDIHLNYASHQQLTPPLTASCSASTVAGSPISLDNLYNDPAVIPHNGFYSNSASHISSPLSATHLVTDIMPNFV